MKTSPRELAIASKAYVEAFAFGATHKKTNSSTRSNEEKRVAGRHLHPFIGDRPACQVCGKKQWDKIHKEQEAAA